jgi:hypothetical protein
MKKQFPSIRIHLILFAIILVSQGCEPSDTEREEAYDAGWDTAYNERCHKIEPPLMIPSQYDDSKNKGILVGEYRSGYADAMADPNLCK